MIYSDELQKSINQRRLLVQKRLDLLQEKEKDLQRSQEKIEERLRKINHILVKLGLRKV